MTLQRLSPGDMAAWMWVLFADTPHVRCGRGWHFDIRDRTLVCTGCGRQLFRLGMVSA